MSSTSANSFGTNLYHELRKEDGNIFFSPASVYTALSILYCGAEGNSELQLKNVLQITDDQNPSSLQTIWQSLLADSSKDVILELCNKLWVQESFPIKTNFVEGVQTLYEAEVSAVNFSSNSAECVKLINNWAMEKTHNKIDNVVSQDDITSLTRVVITNAIYFKGLWQQKFRKALTRPDNFHISKNEKQSIEMMFQENKFVYHEESSYQVLLLPYKDSSINMVVILPKEIDGLSSVEELITSQEVSQQLKKWKSGRKPKVEVHLPKFKFEMKKSLSGHLQNLGMVDLFSSVANLKGVSDVVDDLYVSDIIHKAYIEVNEEGTEAAAVTAVVMNMRCMMMPIPPKVFRADHPFMFFLYDTVNDFILFTGRITNPSA